MEWPLGKEYPPCGMSRTSISGLGLWKKPFTNLYITVDDNEITEKGNPIFLLVAGIASKIAANIVMVCQFPIYVTGIKMALASGLLGS